MTAMDLQAIEQHCRQTSALLDSVEKLALSWAVFQEKLLGSYQNLMRRKRELLEKFPERWQDLAAGEELELSSAGAVLRLRLKGEDSPLRTGCIFFDPKKKRLLVHATNLKLYERLRDLLAPAVRVPAEPEWHASVNMDLACRQILGKEAPSSAYVDLFDRQEYPEPSPEKSAQLDTLNAFFRELTDHLNTGREYSLEALAAKHGLEVEAARQLEQSFRKADAANEIQIEGGLMEYHPPPPSVRREFNVSPWQNTLFLFLDSQRVRELYASIQPSLCVPFAERQAAGTPVGPPPPSLDALPSWLEDLYSNNTQEPDFTLLNTVLHLLLCRGEVFEPVRDYAVEALRLFWRLFVPEKEPHQIECFIRRFGRICYEVIHLAGLADIEPATSAAQAHKANLRPSMFLRAWAKPRPQTGS